MCGQAWTDSIRALEVQRGTITTPDCSEEFTCVRASCTNRAVRLPLRHALQLRVSSTHAPSGRLLHKRMISATRASNQTAWWRLPLSAMTPASRFRSPWGTEIHTERGVFPPSTNVRFIRRSNSAIFSPADIEGPRGRLGSLHWARGAQKGRLIGG